MTTASISEADREYAHGVGQHRPDQAWVLSDRDVWYPNPFYSGPPIPHPEDESCGEDQDALAAMEDAQAREAESSYIYHHPAPDMSDPLDPYADDISF